MIIARERCSAAASISTAYIVGAFQMASLVNRLLTRGRSRSAWGPAEMLPTVV
jgi:hypothetical protein